MKLNDYHLLWAAWLLIVIGFVWDNNRLREEIKELNNKIEIQETISQMNYNYLHEHINKSDSLWIYRNY